MQPQIPIKKSSEEIKSYLKYGRVFGNHLQTIYNYLSRGSLLDSPAAVERYFIEESYKYNKNIKFPFIYQQNQYKEEYGDAVCISINDIVAHKRPDETVFKTGNIISCDFGWQLDGLMYDAAFTVVYGNSAPKWVNAPKEALWQIATSRAQTTWDISNIIEKVALYSNLDIITALAGHGIGRELHEPPKIHNAVGDFVPTKLFNGLVFCAEPIYTYKEDNSEPKQTDVYIDSDRWSIRTVDGQPTSHWETMFYVNNGKLIDLVGITE